jgi:hypothetical protein
MPAFAEPVWVRRLVHDVGRNLPGEWLDAGTARRHGHGAWKM